MIDRAVGIVIAFISLGTLAVILSKRSNTDKVFGIVVDGLNRLFQTAISPIVK